MPTADQQKYSIKQMGLFSDLPDIEYEPRFHIKVVSNVKITKEVMCLSLERPIDFNPIPGQYVWLVLPELSRYSGIIDRRAYSISSDVNSKTIDLLINVTESDFLKKVKILKINEAVDIIGPMGSAFTVSPSGAIMIAGGTGISPFLSILRSHMSDNLCLLAYARKENGSLYTESELKELSSKYGYKIICKKTGPKESDFKHIFSKECVEPIFISGSQGFVNFVTDILLSNGVAPKRIHYEENYPQTEESKKIKEMFVTFFYGDFSNNTQKLLGMGDLFLEVIKQSSNYLIITDHNGYILFANRSAVELSGYTFAEMQGQTPRLWGGLMTSSSYAEGWSFLKRGNAVKRPIINRRRDGSLYTAIATVTPILHKGIFMVTEENITTLREVDKAKTEFVSIASHQLRTPLSVVKWYVEMLLSGDAGALSDKQNKYMQEVSLGNQRMVELVDSLLDASRLELGTLVANRENVNVIELAQSVIDEQKIKIDEKKIILSFTFDQKIPTIQIDPRLMRMVGQNLLSNAIKYTPDNGKINVDFSIYKNDNILVKISDNGYGIPKNQQEKIFTKFFRADNVRLKSTEGTGLGLYIVKMIIENYGGKIWFESEENVGTTFYVLISTKTVTSKTI